MFRYLEFGIVILGGLCMLALYCRIQIKTHGLLSQPLDQLPIPTLVGLAESSVLTVHRIFGIIGILYLYIVYLAFRQVRDLREKSGGLLKRKA